MINQPVVDLHTHPDLKSFLTSNREKNRLDCWETISPPVLFEIIDRLAMGDILGSQTSLEQLSKYKGSVAVVGMYAFEKAMLSARIHIAGKAGLKLLRIAKFIRAKGHDNRLSSKLIKRITSPKTSYYRLFREQLNHLLISRNKGAGFKLLGKFSDYDPNMLNIILTIEGGHNLCNYDFGGNKKKDVLKNLKKLRKKNRYLFLAPAHLENNDLSNHAFGMKIFEDDRFYPSGRGLTPLGRKVINSALKGKKPVFIDVKHMSLLARKEFYRIHKEKYRNVPIIASHVGVTGVSYMNMPIVNCKAQGDRVEVLYYQPDGILDTKFNPWSINLYDEEIEKILDSDGLIGLNLDERILGTRQRTGEKLTEYFSKDEFCRHSYQECLYSHGAAKPQSEELSDFDKHMDRLEANLRNHLNDMARNPHRKEKFIYRADRVRRKYEKIKLRSLRKKRHILLADFDIQHLCNNILHIVIVGGERAWKHICLGSDFDGFINPIEGCHEATAYDHLRKELRRWLPEMALQYPLNMHIIDIEQKLDDFMYRNALRFLEKHFN